MSSLSCSFMITLTITVIQTSLYEPEVCQRAGVVKVIDDYLSLAPLQECH